MYDIETINKLRRTDLIFLVSLRETKNYQWKTREMIDILFIYANLVSTMSDIKSAKLEFTRFFSLFNACQSKNLFNSFYSKIDNYCKCFKYSKRMRYAFYNSTIIRKLNISKEEQMKLESIVSTTVQIEKDLKFYQEKEEQMKELQDDTRERLRIEKEIEKSHESYQAELSDYDSNDEFMSLLRGSENED